MHKIKNFTWLLLGIMIISIGVNVASAKPGYPPEGLRCSEKLVPFNPTGQNVGDPNDPDANEAYVKAFSESHCNQKAPYPNGHSAISQQEVDNTYILPQKAYDDNIITLMANHHHFYHNSTEEDVNFIYKSYIAAFEITLESDALTNAYTSEDHLVCPTFNGQPGNANDPNTIKGKFARCENNAKDPNLFGGTKITRVNTGGGQKITWWFGVDDPYQRPWRSGYNPSVDIGDNPQIFPFDTSLPIDPNTNMPIWPAERTMEGYVWMFSQDKNPATIWTATTTSKALVIDVALPQASKFNYNNGNAWQVLNPSTYNPTPAVQAVYNPITQNWINYYWVPIGTVSTVWKPIAQPESWCTGLEIIAPNNLTHLNNNWYEYTPNTSATFIVKPSFSDFEVPLDYKWSAKEHKINIGKVDLLKIKDNKVPFNYNLLLQNNLMQISIGQVPSLSIQNPGITINSGIELLYKYGRFYEDQSTSFSNPSSGKNPYFERDNFGFIEDKLTYYTGGPEGTLITVEAINKGGTAYVGNECRAFIIIPKPPKDNSCIDLTLSPDSLAPWTEQTFTATPEFEDPANPFLLDFEWSTSSQPPIVQYSSNNESSIPAIIKDGGTGIKIVNPGDFVELQPGIELKSIGGTNLLAKAGGEDISLSPGTLGTLKPSGIDIGSSPDSEPQPDQPMQPLSLYDWFEDSAGTGNYFNPFLDVNTSLPNDIQAHYTGGAPETWLTVKGYDKDGSLYPLCVASLQIPPEEVKECIDLEIYRNGTLVPNTVPVEDPLDNLDLQIQTDPTAYFSELEYVWETTNGSLSTNGQSGTTVTTENPADTVDLTGGTNGTTVSVYAIDPSDNTIFPACTDEFTLATSPQNICLDLQLINTNPNLKAGEYTALKANPVNQNSPHPNLVQWSEQGSGYFSLGATSLFLNNNIPGSCPTPPVETNQTFKASKACDYIYNAGPNGGGSFHVEADPNLGDVAVCKYDYTVPTTPPPGTPYCTDLNISPNSINRGDRTVYSGNATFSDGKTYNVDVDWTGQNGEFSNGSTFHRQSNLGSNSFSNYFDHSPENASGRVEVEVSKVYDNDVSNNFSQCREVLTIPALDDECEYLNLKWPDDDIVCVDTDHDGNFVWGKNGTTWTSNDICIPADIDTDTITVEAVGFEEECNDEWNPDEIPPEYDLEKYVSKSNRSNTYTKKIQTIANDHTTLWYKLVFSVEGGQSTTATITDDIFEGDLLAEIYPENVPFEDLPAFRGRISYDNRLVITEDGKSGDLRECNDLSLDEDEDEDPEHCYNYLRSGREFAIELVRVTNDVTIQYQAEVQSGLNDDECKKGKVCQEKYRNRSEVSIEEINEERVDMSPIRSNEIEIQIFCQYILTQAAGDVFLERDLTYGVDIQQCSEFTSTTGVVIVPDKPKEPTIVSTGAGATVFSVSHELCTTGQAGGLVDAYGQEIVPNLSAQICEVKLRTGEAWKKEFITNSIEENKTRLSRWGADYLGDTNMFSLKGDLSSYEDKSVFHIAGNLTIDTPYTLNDGDGAKTFIVEGDLNILDNIEYGACPADKQPCTIRETASLAFIVLNGNIYIDPSVKTISGVYFVQGEEGSNNGRLYSGTSRNDFDLSSNITLRVFGSIYGDIDQLFKNRAAAGDPALGEAGITIRFDERIILNTPAGLRDVLNLSQTEVAR